MKKFLSCFVPALFFVLAVDASAYVPPSSYLIQQMAKKHSKLKGLRVKTRITGTENQIKEVFWLDLASRTMKGRFFDANDQEIYAYQRTMNESDSLVSQILFGNDPSKVALALIASGIPVVTEEAFPATAASPVPEQERRAAEKTGIDRLNGKVGWTIGKGTPSFWILKDEFTPLKLVHKLDGSPIEVRFEDTTTTREFPFSRSITLLRGEEFVLKGEAMEVMVNPDLTDMKKISVTGLPPIPTELSSATRKLIEDWIQWIR